MANRLVDGGFESWASATDLTNWIEVIAGTSTVNRESTQKLGGGYSCRFDVDSSNSNVAINQFITNTAGRKYKIQIWYKMYSGSSPTAYLLFRDSSETVYLQDNGTWGAYHEILLSYSATWTLFEINFTAHTSYITYQIILARSSAAGASIYFDNISLYSRDSCGFAWDNKWDDGAISATTEATNFPAINTQHRWHLKHWRSTSVATAQNLVANMGTAKDVAITIIKYNNFTVNAAVSCYGDSDPDFSPPECAGDLGVINNDIMVYYWPTIKSYQYWMIHMTDVANPDGYLRVGRVYLGPIFEPERNFCLGGGMGGKTDPSLITESDDGQESAILKTKYRRGEFEFKRLSEADKDRFESMFDSVGMARPFFFCQDLGDPWQETWYVYISAFEIVREYNHQFTIRLSLREAR